MTWSKDQMWDVMNCCVILHNMTIESERENPVDEKEKKVPYFRQSPLVGEDPEEIQRLPVPASWSAFLAMREEIQDPLVHQQLQRDLVEHVWRRKGEV